jgi:hypothetical protein
LIIHSLYLFLQPGKPPFDLHRVFAFQNPLGGVKTIVCDKFPLKAVLRDFPLFGGIPFPEQGEENHTPGNDQSQDEAYSADGPKGIAPDIL